MDKTTPSSSCENLSLPVGTGYKLPSKPTKRGTLSRSTHVFNLKVDDVLKRALEHEKYTNGGITLTGLPKFDDMHNYGVSTEAEKQLWTLEIERLIANATSEDAMIFKSNGILDKTDLATFEVASNLADQILCNFAIINHDNSLHVLEHCRWIGVLSQAVPDFKNARTRLTTRFEQDEDKVKARRPKLLDPPESNQVVYFALVDYITGTVARLLVRSASSEYWNSHCLAILAKWAAKLKILSYDPAHCASLSIGAAEDMLARMTDSDAKENVTVLKIRATDASESDKDGMDIDAQGEADITGYYFQDHYMQRARLSSLFYYAVSALYASEKTGNPSNCFEVCTLIYETGLERSLTVISSDRRGDVVATSDAAHVTCSYAASLTLMKNLEHLKTNSQPPHGDVSERTSIRWQWSEEVDNRKAGSFSTSRFDDVVSIILPLALADTHTGIDIGFLLDYATGSSEEEDPVIQFDRKHFTAEFVVTTAAWEDKQHKQKFANAAHAPDPDVVPVSRSPFNKTIRAGTILAGVLDARSNKSKSNKPDADALRRQANAELYKVAKLRMNDWIIAETTVTLKCYRYVYTVLSICVLFICGAMAVPFSVQNRLRGVDPFNITTFTWLLAGFVVVIAKSRYVCEWPWHDFLRGQVVCKSIKEMADVTGIDEQMILTSLLHNESDTTLITKGPYNGMFERRAESGNEGFSIDIPVQLSTMLASGFIVLKVLSVKGERLICLDVRKDTEWGRGAALSRRRRDHLTCAEHENANNFEESVDGSIDGITSTKVLRLSRASFMWTRVLGVYVKDSLFG